MYESPITQYITDIQTKVENQLENHLMETLFGLGFDVDKEELMKALKYDREQYQKGYKDGREILVRCKDCACVRAVHMGNKFVYRCPMSTVDVEPEGYCSRGVRRNEC